MPSPPRAQVSFFPVGPYKRVRALVTCSTPGTYQLVSVADPSRDEITDPARRWSQALANIKVSTDKGRR